MRRSNYCEFFRFNDQYCDVFIEDDAFLYAEAEPFNWPYLLTCKEYRPAENGGFIVSDYCGADTQYLEKLEPAPIDIAEEIIASEERYTLECLARSNGYDPRDVVADYLEDIRAGEDWHETFIHLACLVIDREYYKPIDTGKGPAMIGDATMYEFEKIALTGKSYERDNGGKCYLYPNKNHYRVNWLSDEKRAKGYKVFSACVDVVTIPREYMHDISDKPALDDRDVVTVEFQFVTRAKTRRGIVDAATRHAYNVGPWCYIPACVSAIWGNGFDLVKDIKLGAYDRLER